MTNGKKELYEKYGFDYMAIAGNCLGILNEILVNNNIDKIDDYQNGEKYGFVIRSQDFKKAKEAVEEYKRNTDKFRCSIVFEEVE